MALPPPYERLANHRAERITVAGLRWRFALAITLVTAGFLLLVAVLAALT